MAGRSRIDTSPKVMLGKPVIRGTCIPVEFILRKLSEGMAETDVLNAYPRLTRADLRAALAYAANTIGCEEVVVAPTAGAVIGIRTGEYERRGMNGNAAT